MFSFVDYLSVVCKVVWLFCVVILLVGCGSCLEYGVLVINV